MFHVCRHIMTCGRKCQAAAIRGTDFCYFHSRVHRKPQRGKKPDIEVPDLEDRCAIQFVIAQVVRHLLAGKIKRAEANTVLYAMQLASQNIDRSVLAIPTYLTVEEFTEAEDGKDLGPEEINCDYDDSCVDCPHAQTCSRYDPNRTGDEEDEDDGHLDSRLVLEALRARYAKSTAPPASAQT